MGLELGFWFKRNREERRGGRDTTRTSTPLEADEGLVGLPEGVGDAVVVI